MIKDEAYFRKRIEEIKSLVDEIDEGNLYIAKEIAEMETQLKAIKKKRKNSFLMRLAMKILNKNS